MVKLANDGSQCSYLDKQTSEDFCLLTTLALEVTS
jgi:hypothetical protein